ncbi:hypothetical protein EV401DRAFT_2070153 [Pisolithus croceorrhizus]|nr:hypothetical protein EV401DRAFT_2070153 [Pisolithus croceorrhizus]
MSVAQLLRISLQTSNCEARRILNLSNCSSLVVDAVSDNKVKTTIEKNFLNLLRFLAGSYDFWFIEKLGILHSSQLSGNSESMSMMYCLIPRIKDVVPVQDNSTPLNTDNSRLITEQLPSQCLRFRILVIGQAGVGKSTLIQRAFGIEQASPSHTRPGKTDIEKEFIPPQINRFILHDSQGFEAGIDYSDVLVKKFIVRRKMQQHVKDRLHAVWLCLSTPIEDSEDILLHCSVETFLKEHRSVLQNIPTVVVFTKYDKLLTNMEKQDKVDPDAAAKQYLQKQCFDPIARFARDANLSYIAVSSSPGLAGRYEQLIELTYKKVMETFGSQSGTPPPSAVHLIARRSLPHSEIALSIAVGKRKYWTALTSGANFWECFAIIHTGIVSVWNFYDPFQYLSGDKFRTLMTGLAGIVDASTCSSSRLPRSTATNATGEIILAASGRAVRPFKVGLVPVQRAHKTYQQLLNLRHKLTAYVVDLVNVLEIVFALTADNSTKLTRGVISLAFNVYYQSEMRRESHSQIENFNYKILGRDAVLEKILSLVKTSPITKDDISKALESAPREYLERDEEWYVDDVNPEREKRLASLTDLVDDLNVQFRKEGSIGILTDAIALQHAIPDLMPRWHRERFASLVRLTDFLDERFRMVGSTEDLTQIITPRSAVLELTPPGHQLRVASLVHLANSLHERFKREGGTEDLTKAITLRRAALELTPAGHQSLHERCKREGGIKDLSEIITLRRTALRHTLPEHPNYPAFLVNLLDHLDKRFKNEGGIEDLSEIISLRRTALQLTPLEHPDYYASLLNLLDYLDERFGRDGRTEDLTEIITLRRAVLKLTPSGHQGRFVSLVNLSNRLHERFRRPGTPADLEETIILRRDALQCAPPTSSDRCISLLHLANCLCAKYTRLSVEAELTEAVTHVCAALRLCPPEHYVSCRNCLANCVELKTRKWRVPAPTSSNVEKVVRNIIAETTKTLPLRLLSTRTGVLCNRDAQLSYFEGSAEYDELLSSSVRDGPEFEEPIRKAVFKFFRYTILSHRWGCSEPLLRDIERKNIYTLEGGEGIAKLQNFCIITLQHDYAWTWSDTCCIDKDSSSELQEAIVSMFCYVWFSRGWTLQELLASPRILFYRQDWSLYVDSTPPNHKVDSAVLTELRGATGIGESHLKNFSPGMGDARSRLQWASARSTTRPEDAAYSLFGIFQVHLPIFYGETVENALGRLLVEIISQSGDTSVMDWAGKESSFHSCLPADLKPHTPYEAVSCPQATPSDPTNGNDIDPEKVHQMHSALAQLPSPRFLTGRRLVLPCIVHRITRVRLLETSPGAPLHYYEIVAPGLVPLKLALSSHL